jgi:serine/threonine protein kinase
VITGRTPLSQGTVLQGRYRIECVLGAGAFGRVYLAEDTQDAGSPAIAIKELLDAQFATPDDKREAIGWFKREAGILLGLDHRSIPAIHGFWTAHGAAGPFYLAMEYIPGKTLADLLQQVGRVPWREVVQWGIALCDVLGYLHSQRPPFVFRDMKLENILLDSRTQLPVLIDFGITRQLVAATGTAIGTWGYVPMEQVLGHVDPRSDLYALGATLHALLTGRRPEAEYTRLQRRGLTVEGAMRALFPPAHTLVPDVPPALAQVLATATAFAATDRFPDAATMAAALNAVRSHAATGSGAPMGTTAPAQGTAGLWDAVRQIFAQTTPPIRPQRAALSQADPTVRGLAPAA